MCEQVRLRAPAGSIDFGYASGIYRSSASIAVIGLYAAASKGGLSAFTEDARALGWSNLLLGAALQGSSMVFFPLACALTTAANVLVVLACGPLVTSLICWAVLKLHMPRRTWVACVLGFASVALVFSGSVNASGDQLGGCVLAALSTVGFSAFWCLATHLGECVLSLLSSACTSHYIDLTPRLRFAASTSCPATL